MFEVESMKELSKILSSDDFIKLATHIYETIAFLDNNYPNHKKWYFKKQLSGILDNEREILFIRKNEQVISVSCLKKDEEERKICTLYVADDFRHLGLATKILESSMKWLETTKPFITFTDSKLNDFKPIIDKYGWKLEEIVDNYYLPNTRELCYNGTLTKEYHNRLKNR